MDNANDTNNTGFAGDGGGTRCDGEKALEPYFKVAVYISILVASVAGNTAIISVIHRTPRLRNATNLLIVNLAVSDLLGSLFNLSVSIATHLRLIPALKNDWTGRVSCALLPPLQGFFTYCSWFSIAVIAVDRFCAVMFPLHRIMSPCVIKICLAGTWLVSLAFMSPLFYAMKIIEISGRYRCLEIWEPLFDTYEARKNYTLFLFFTSYVLPLTIMVPMYSCVIYRVWFRTIPGNVTDAIQRVQSRSKKKVLRTLVTVVVVFVLCCFPLQIFNFLQFFWPSTLSKCVVTPNEEFAIFCLVFANCAINPSIYFIFNDEYRRALCKSFRSLSCACGFRWRSRMSRDHSRYHVTQEVSVGREVIAIASFRTLNDVNHFALSLEELHQH